MAVAISGKKMLFKIRDYYGNYGGVYTKIIL